MPARLPLPLALAGGAAATWGAVGGGAGAVPVVVGALSSNAVSRKCGLTLAGSNAIGRTFSTAPRRGRTTRRRGRRIYGVVRAISGSPTLALARRRLPLRRTGPRWRLAGRRLPSTA